MCACTGIWLVWNTAIKCVAWLAWVHISSRWTRTTTRTYVVRGSYRRTLCSIRDLLLDVRLATMLRSSIAFGIFLSHIWIALHLLDAAFTRSYAHNQDMILWVSSRNDEPIIEFKYLHGENVLKLKIVFQVHDTAFGT
jgi:hypothetical protein